MGTAEGSKDNIVANASRWAPPGRELGDPGEERGGEERAPDSRVPGGERERWWQKPVMRE